jgi:hypothetical protein
MQGLLFKGKGSLQLTSLLGQIVLEKELKMFPVAVQN